MGKTDPRVLRTKSGLRQALIDLLQKSPEKPYEEISVKEISQRAGYNHSTFYAHYTNKSDLLGDIIISGFVIVQPDDSRLAVEDSRDFVKRLILAALDFISANPKVGGVALREIVYSPYMWLTYNSIINSVIAWEASVDVLKNASAEQRIILARAIVDGCFGVFTWWLTNKTTMDGQQVAEQLTDMVFHMAEAFGQ